ncbi:hypothetical protein Tco_0949049, partial [Tanacetum coccineum]
TRVRYGFLNRLFSWFAVVVVSAGYRTVCLLALIVVRGSDFIPPPDYGDGIVRFVLYDFTKPSAPSSSDPLDHVDMLPLCLLKTFSPRSNLECKSATKRQRQEECIASGIRSWGMPGGCLQLLRETLAEPAPSLSDTLEEDLESNERNIKKCKRKICDGHYSAAIRVLSSSVKDLRVVRLVGGMEIRVPTHMDCLSGVAVAISDELIASITQVVNLLLDGKCPKMLGGYIASAPLTPLVKPGGGIRPIAVGTFGVGVSGGGEAILHAVNRLIEDRNDDIALHLKHNLLPLFRWCWIRFQKCFNLVGLERLCYSMESLASRCPVLFHDGFLYKRGDPSWSLLFALVLHPLICKIKDSFSLSLHAWYLDDGTIVGDTLVVGKVLELIMEDGPRRGLHLNVDKTKVFWPREDPRSRLVGVFPPSIARPLHGVKLLGGPVSVDFDFNSGLVLKRVSNHRAIDVIAMLNDLTQHSFDTALRSSLERIVTGPGFGNWQWRLATLPFAFGGLDVYSAGDVLNYAFIASRMQSAALQTKLLQDVGIVATGSTFDDVLWVFNTAMEVDFLSNPSDVAAPKLMKTMADIYFTRVTKDAKSSFSLSSRQMALWQSQMEDHTSDWLRAVLISGLGQTMNGRTYWCVLCYRLGVPLFSVTKPCSAYSRVFTRDIYGDHAVSCAGIVGIKHRHNVVRDTLVDICYRSGISSGKEVDIGLGGGSDKSLRPTDVLLYSWDVGRDVCVDLTGSSPLTQTGLVDFLPGRVVTEAAQRKRVKYEAKCADIGYGFLPFSFSSFGGLEKDVVTLLKRIRKFSMAQDIGARATVHIFNRIGFSIAKGVGAQIVSRLPSNLL